MEDSGSFLSELEQAVGRGTPESRRKAIDYATNALIAGDYSEDQIWLFGEVIEKLAKELEVAARAQLSNRLAAESKAPAGLMTRLASDDNIEVARPVLRHSQRIDPRILLAIAQSKGQPHLLAISERKSISADVADVLVSRGNRDVLRSVAVNPGAQLSEGSFLSLVKRSENDTILAEGLGQRRDIPRQVFQQLVAKASEAVRQKLASERPDMADQIDVLVADATGDMQSKVGPASKAYFDAKKEVTALHRAGALSEKRIIEYALANKLEATVVGLSLMTSLPSNIVERAFNGTTSETQLILAKSLGFTWKSAMALVFLGAPNHVLSRNQLDKLEAEFANLDRRTARLVLKSYWDRRGEAEPKVRVLRQLHDR